MLTATFNETTIETQYDSNFQLCLTVGNSIMVLSTIIFSICLLLSYPMAGMFNMGVEIGAHIGTFVMPALFKIGYVLRCIARKHFGQEV